MMIFLIFSAGKIFAAKKSKAESDAEKFEKLFKTRTNLELYSDTDCSSGAKFKSPVFDSSFYLNYKDLKNDDSAELKKTFGFSFFTNSLLPTFPCQLKFGNLNFSGSLSKINNPLISSFSSPFSLSPMTVCGVTSSLPSYSSFSKPLGIFMEAGFYDKKKIIQKVQLNYWSVMNKENEGVSLLVETGFPAAKNEIRISSSITTGIFSYDEVASSKWFLTEPYHSAGKNIASSIQFAIQFNKFYVCFMDNIYQNPFNDFNSIYRIDSKYNGKNFTFCLNGFYSPAQKFETPSSKKITRQIQGATSVQYKTRFRNMLIKTGLGGSSTFYFQDQNKFPFSTDEKELCTEWKVCQGINLSTNFTSINFSSALCGTSPLPGMNENVKSEITGISGQIKNTYYFSKITPAISFSANVNPSENFAKVSTTFKTAFYLSTSTNPQVSGNTSFSTTLKENKFTNKKFSGTVTATLKLPNFNLKGKLTFEIKQVE